MSVQLSQSLTYGFNVRAGVSVMEGQLTEMPYGVLWVREGQFMSARYGVLWVREGQFMSVRYGVLWVREGQFMSARYGVLWALQSCSGDAFNVHTVV